MDSVVSTLGYEHEKADLVVNRSKRVAKPLQTTLQRRVAAGRQPRGNRLPAMISEDLEEISVRCNLTDIERVFKKPRLESTSTLGGVQLPKGARKVVVEGGEGAPEVVAKIGLPRSPGAVLQ